MTVRTRLAPSPTGSMHIGGVRTALYCYALAKKNEGQYILRIEDTDTKRFVEGSIEEILKVHEIYGIKPDEGPTYGGNYGPYIQTQRKEIYQKYAHELVEKGHAYYCFLFGDELENLQNEFLKKGTGFRSPYRDMPIEEAKQKIDSGEKYVIRMKTPNNEKIEYTDGVQGKVVFDSNMVSDQIILKSNGLPTYHLAVVVDDHLMEITHVFRGVEWLTSTPKQILLYRFLGWEMPPFYHLSTILDPDTGKKLSKRSGTVSAMEFIREGYIPEAVNNFLMLLGWSPPIERAHGEKEREIFTLDEFIELFDPKDLNKSNPVFNRQKLLWFNKEYIKNMNTLDLANRVVDWVKNYLPDRNLLSHLETDPNLEDKVKLVKDRCYLIKDLVESISFFYHRPENIVWEIKQLKNVPRNQIPQILEELKNFLTDFSENSSDWLHEKWEKGIRNIADKFTMKHGDAFMILRLSVTGKPVSPPLFEALQLLGKQEIISRIESALKSFK
ncbi:MAG: glutamate--tRNA ligase [Candidatus Dojkabacteria bacterium]|nr:MAG: glutamate--tRNA ligase [Candidatus Dojkabacteria bacterium]